MSKLGHAKEGMPVNCDADHFTYNITRLLISWLIKKRQLMHVATQQFVFKERLSQSAPPEIAKYLTNQPRVT